MKEQSCNEIRTAIRRDVTVKKCERKGEKERGRGGEEKRETERQREERDKERGRE